MAEARALKLRTFLTASAVGAGALGLMAALTLVYTTTALRRVVVQLGDGIESVRAAEELEVNLLFYERELELGITEVDPNLRERRRQESVHWLSQAERYVTSEEESKLIAAIREDTRAYFDDPSTSRMPLLRSAIEASEKLSELNVAQARVAQARAREIVQAANVTALVSAALLAGGLIFVIVTARRRLYRPLIGLREGIVEYKRGDRSRRVPEAGPSELREIAAEFNDMADTLDQQHELQLQFVAGVAHDLKNPLQALKMSAGLAARGGADAGGQGSRRFPETIGRQVDRLARMVNDLLDRTRIEAGTLELRKEACDLRELATEVIELHRPTTEHHHLELQLPAEPVFLSCDATRMGQVLTNLVNNAIKYSPQGGTVELALRKEPARILLRVSDEGVGVAPADLEGIFQPFKRSDSTRDTIPGVGLGLSVARRIVRAHGGELRVQPRSPRGTTFEVELPAER